MIKNKQFISVYFTILALFVLNFILFESNESSILATAHHYVDPNWIKGDWWLSTGIEYGSLFNLFAGTLYKYTNYFTTFLLGKLFVYSLWAYVLTLIVTYFRISLFLIPLMVCFVQKNQSMGFGEWMFTGFETKTFAYLAFMAGLLCLIKQRFKSSFFLFGLSVSFHVLIGLYLSLAIFLVLLLDRTLIKKIDFQIKYFFKFSPLFILGSLAGIIAIIKWKLSSQNVDPSIVQWGAIIYVTKRVSHHVLYEFKIYSTAFIVGFFALAYFYKKKCEVPLMARLLIAVTGVSLLYFLLGISVAKLGLLPYLKFYFFRTPDVLVPFTTTLLLFSLLSFYLEKKEKMKFIKIFLIVLFLAGFSRSLYKGHKGSLLFFEKWAEKNDPAYSWIKHNTQATDTFMIQATNQDFYVFAERPIFVAFKHSPQKEKHIVEWYKRLTVLNGGAEPNGSSWDLPLLLNIKFKTLTADYLKKSMKENNLKYLFVKKDIT